MQHQKCCDHDTCQGKQNSDALAAESTGGKRSFKGKERDQCRASDYDMGILKADKCDEKADTYGHRNLERFGNSIKDSLTYIGE